MAKLVFGLNQSLDGYVDHEAFGPGPALFRHFIQQVRSLAGMIAAFRARFPDAPVECNAIEDSQLFGRTFDAIVAWGLIFLLAPDAQATLIQKAASALEPGGRFVFTAPRQACAWADTLTGQTSVSLGVDRYREIVEQEGLSLVGETEDEGQNHYYFCLRRIQHA